MIFVDTSAWFATFAPKDPNHEPAALFYSSTPARLLITTDYVLSETLTLFKMRGEARRAFEFGRQILETRLSQLVWVEKQDVYKAWTIFDSFRDKGWSFTDCVSHVLMERLQINTAFAFDIHFREFGSVMVVP
jgi:uncharacterized protein